MQDLKLSFYIHIKTPFYRIPSVYFLTYTTEIYYEKSIQIFVEISTLGSLKQKGFFLQNLCPSAAQRYEQLSLFFPKSHQLCILGQYTYAG